MKAALRWTHVALVRGINVGGKNIVRMADLQAALTAEGLDDVATYIQSGNVLFASQGSSAATTATLEARIERTLATTFRCNTVVVVRTGKDLEDVVRKAPPGFGVDDAFRYYVIFCKAPVTAAQVVAAVKPKAGVDSVGATRDVVYFATLKAKASSSALPRIAGTPVYKGITIRNWNTTAKLNELMATAAAAPLATASRNRARRRE